MAHRLWTPALILCLCGALPAQGKRAYPEFVDAKIEASIQRGLQFLVRSQNRDGSWRGSGVGCVMTTPLIGVCAKPSLEAGIIIRNYY